MKSNRILWICAVINTMMMIVAWVGFGSGAFSLTTPLIVSACAAICYAILIANL